MQVNAPRINPILKTYECLFGFIAQHRLRHKDINLREVHSLFVSVLVTSPIMWSYVFLASSTIDSKMVLWIGVLSSLIHMLSPLVYRKSNSSFAVINTMLFGGTLFITVTTYYTGGFESFAILWYVSTPMLASISSGRRGAKLWSIVGFTCLSTFYILSINHYQFPDLMTSEGHRLAKQFLIFGWFALGAVLSFIFVVLKEKSEQLLTEEGNKVDALFRVLFHDLANSLGRISIGHTIAKRDLSGPSGERGLQIATEAADSMIEITQNVRRMYAVSKGKVELDLSLTPLNESLHYVSNVFSSELEKKNMHILWDHKKLEGLKLLVEPISFKNQVLGNLISNSIKFSTPGSSIHITAYPHNHQNFIVEIKDFGVGMPATILGHLFDMNKKTSRQGTCGEFGTGFGMHIMKSFLDVYNGDVKVESVEEGSYKPSGTTFKLLLKGEWT
jgi:signal transduction histidine kinase